MCEKNLENMTEIENLRSKMRDMQVGESLSLTYDPNKKSLSSIRVSASTLGTDLGRKYRVSKKDERVFIERKQ